MQQTYSIDLSGDIGEGAGNDAAFIPLLTSANIACGGHAGDERSIVAAMETAIAHGVRIGAHPGFADRDNFGRREMPATAKLVYDTVAEQLAYFQHLASRKQVMVTHVKAHGALYHQTARDPELADAFLRAVVLTLPSPAAIVGPWRSAIEEAARNDGLGFVREAFADRAYDASGQLVSRSDPRALLSDGDRVVAQALQIIESQSVIALDGTSLPIAAETLCLHGDSPGAIALAARLRKALHAVGVNVKLPN